LANLRFKTGSIDNLFNDQVKKSSINNGDICFAPYSNDNSGTMAIKLDDNLYHIT
jgi:hypothetical protein